MKRSKEKSEEFFKTRIEKSSGFIQNAINDLETGKIDESREVAYKRFLFTQMINLSIAKYSAGYDLETIVDDWDQLISLMHDFWKSASENEKEGFYFDDYIKLIWVLVFSHTETETTFAKIVAVIENGGYKDWLLEFLISSRIQGRPNVDTLIFPKPYASLKKAVDETDPAKRSAIVKHYLEKEWYPGHKGVYWYDNHKSKHDTFFGYWSFEAAAVVKIAGIDDSSFRDNEYYPKDMV